MAMLYIYASYGSEDATKNINKPLVVLHSKLYYMDIEVIFQYTICIQGTLILNYNLSIKFE